MMNATPVQVTRARTEGSLESDLRAAEIVAQLMDSQFEVGKFRFGLDAVIGLIPVAGDAVSFLIGLYPIMLARKHKLGKTVIVRMLMNLGVDFLAGSIPVVGDAFDAFNKANLKNLELLRKAAEKQKRKRFI